MSYPSREITLSTSETGEEPTKISGTTTETYKNRMIQDMYPDYDSLYHKFLQITMDGLDVLILACQFNHPIGGENLGYSFIDESSNGSSGSGGVCLWEAYRNSGSGDNYGMSIEINGIFYRVYHFRLV